MNAFLIGGVILVAILMIWLAFETLQGRQKSGAIEAQMTELRRDLQTIATSQAQSTGQLETIAKSVAQRLDSVAPALQDAVKNSAQITGQMTSDAQNKMADELKNTRDQISQMQLLLGEAFERGDVPAQPIRCGFYDIAYQGVHVYGGRHDSASLIAAEPSRRRWPA